MGRGKDKPLPKDFKSLKALADQGDAETQGSLADRYYQGDGVEKDTKTAMKWYRQAAEQGIVEAQRNLGRMYEEGEGVLEDFVIAYAWYNIVAVSGDETAQNNKGIIAKKMTLGQVRKAQKLSKEMVKKNPKLIKKP